MCMIDERNSMDSEKRKASSSMYCSVMVNGVTEAVLSFPEISWNFSFFAGASALRQSSVRRASKKVQQRQQRNTTAAALRIKDKA